MTDAPSWNLSDLYKSITDKKIAADFSSAEKLAIKFQKNYAGKITKISSREFEEAIKIYEKIEDVLSKLASYAQLKFAEDSSDPKHAKFYQDTIERVTTISSKLLFFTLEINKLSEKSLNKLTKKTDHYWPWVREVRAYAAYQLSDELEEFIHESSVVTSAAWSKLFDETTNGMQFDYSGNKLSNAEIFDLLSDKNRNTRERAAKSIGKGLESEIKTLAAITNNLAKLKSVEDGFRKFPKPISSRNVSNQAEDEVVDALIKTVKKNYKNLSHKYYKQKAKMLGLKKLEHFDRNAPLPETKQKTYSFKEARDIVLDAYEEFSPELAHLAKEFFDKKWIDADPRPGKDSGAFSHPVAASVHPYILMNYQGKVRDIMTLAHELGHGVHQQLSKKQGALMFDTPLTLAETASVFGEMLTFKKLLSMQESDAQRKVIIAGKVEDMLNTVVRQIAFCEFERDVHDARKNGELSVDQLGKIWLAKQKESLGPAFNFSDEYKYFWSYIPHFIHSPFYVYAYAFGDCLVNSLYGVYEKTKDKNAFANKYLDMLSAGGTLRHKELLAPFNLDASKPKFWQKGLDVIEGYIAEIS